MILVIDVGGTTTRIGVSRIGVKLDRHREISTPQGAKGLAEIAQQGLALLGGKPATGVVIGLPGTVDDKGRLFRAPHLPEWQGINPAKILAEVSHGAVIVVNDAVMAALGEAHVGSGTTKGVMAYITVSTGVNGARLVNGVADPEHGAEIGKQVVNLSPLQTLEQLVSGHSLQQRYGRLPSLIDDPAVWQAEIRALAVGLHNLSMHWVPEVIVLGGSMMHDIPLVRLEHELAKLPNPFAQRAELRPAALGQIGGLHGGLALWRRHG